MSLELSGLHDGIAPYAGMLVDALRRSGLRVVVTSVRRSREEQAKLYAAYLAGRNPYPVAPPGRSAHEHGLAWDMDVRFADGRDGAPLAGAWWKSIGGVWSASDRVHFGVRT